jgi:uncharacterized OB-fold protein
MRGDKQMKVIIDRFEGDYAVVELEDRSICNMHIKLLPEGVEEGSVIKIEIDNESTKNKKEEIKKLMDELWE